MLVSIESATQTLIAALSLHKASYKPVPNGSSASNFSNPKLGGVYAFAVQNTHSRDDKKASCLVEDYTAPDVHIPSFPPYDEKLATVFRYRKQLSVNLGSWFVQENWMNPPLVLCAAGPKASELDVASGWGNIRSAKSRLEKHWDTWITEYDFNWLQQIGINTVRIPIGYWSLGASYCQDTPFEDVADIYEQSWPRVLRAIYWASKYNIGVLIDLHGAPGSQNGKFKHIYIPDIHECIAGQSHAGTSDGKTQLFDDEHHIKKTIKVLTFLTQQLVRLSNVVGIQILNEPQNIASLPNFYTTHDFIGFTSANIHADDRVIGILRKVAPEAAHFPFYIHDRFDLERFSRYVGKRKDFVVQDHHSYFVFTPDDSSKSVGDHISNVNSSVMSSLATASEQARHNLVIDEWSCALTPESLSKLSGGLTQQAARKSFCSIQSSVYLRTTAGWSFWSYKTENCDSEDGWCFRKAVGRNLPTKFSVWGDFGDARQVGHHTWDKHDFQPGHGQERERVRLAAMRSTVADVNSKNVESHGIIPRNGNSEDVSPAGSINGALPPIIPLRRASYLLAPIYNFSSFARNIGLGSVGSGSTIARCTAQSKLGGETQAGKPRFLASDSKGYQDGYTVAISFAKFDSSGLGFTTQYMEDTLTALLWSDSIRPGNEDSYRKGFMHGLVEGERKIEEAIARGAAIPDT